jgi:hypothetical protein
VACSGEGGHHLRSVPMLWSSVRMIRMFGCPMDRLCAVDLLLTTSRPTPSATATSAMSDQWTALSPHGCFLDRTVVHEACTMAGPIHVGRVGELRENAGRTDPRRSANGLGKPAASPPAALRKGSR